jgi:hypothetical protein
MPRSDPPEFRRKVLDLLRAGRTVAQVAADLQTCDQRIYNLAPARADRHTAATGLVVQRPRGVVAARRRIAKLEPELAVTRRATRPS